MKNYKEVASCVFERRAQYEKEQQRKRKILTRTLTPVCCLCLVAFIGMGIRQGIYKQPVETLQDAVYPGLKDNFDEVNGANPNDPQANNRIVVHKTQDLSGEITQLFALMINDFIPMEAQELNAYYGVGIFGQAPAGWQEKENVGGIFRREDGTGEVYWDFNSVTYENASKALIITVAKETKDNFKLFEFIADEERSLVNNWEVAIGQTPEGEYQADFLYENVGFRVVAKGFSQEEFVTTLSSLLP